MTMSIDLSSVGDGGGLLCGGGGLRIAARRGGPFAESIFAAGHEFVPLPDETGDDIGRSVQERLADGEVMDAFFERERVDLLLDVDAANMTFSPMRDGREHTVSMTPGRHDVTYVTHMIDPVTEMLHRMDWGIRWLILEDASWVKWVWDATHAKELRRLGAGGVMSLPMGVADRAYPTAPLPERPEGAPVLFVGHPATSFFKRGTAFEPSSTREGLIAAACAADDGEPAFYEMYYDLYRFAEPPTADDEPRRRAEKTAVYFRAKLFYNFFLAVRQRDRFVQYLREQLKEQFELIGDFWDECYGISHTPRIDGVELLTRAYRGSPICVNLTKGNAESGLNLRHFEVTAAGGFLLTYEMSELSRYFEVGKECVAFRTERDLLDKIRYYLAHPKERIEIALAGQKRTLRDHLYSYRIKRLIEQLGDRIKPRGVAALANAGA